jgi:hypothetical protein
MKREAEHVAAESGVGVPEFFVGFELVESLSIKNHPGLFKFSLSAKLGNEHLKLTHPEAK